MTFRVLYFLNFLYQNYITKKGPTRPLSFYAHIVCITVHKASIKAKNKAENKKEGNAIFQAFP